LSSFISLHNTHYIRNVTNEKIVQEKHGDWKFVQFLKGLDGVRFPSLKESWQNPLTQNQNDLLEAFSSILKEFGTRGGGTNRKIMISLLKQKGVNSQFLAEFSGISQRWVNSCKNKTTEDELNGFYKRFSLSKKKNMFSKEELETVKRSFEQSCPSDSYSKGKTIIDGNGKEKFVQNYRQICGDRELYEKYIRFVQEQNRQKELESLRSVVKFSACRIRCYNVFLEWKKQFKEKQHKEILTIIVAIVLNIGMLKGVFQG